MTRARPSYWDYIRVEDLLALQGGLDRDERGIGDDEVRFLVIHQVDELWFKIALRELTTARDLFKPAHVPEPDVAAACKALHRVGLVFQLATKQFELMETMRTQDYLAFRDKLSPASGFQSAQMREIEVLLGLDDKDRIPFGFEGSHLAALRNADGSASPALERVQRRMADRPTLKDAIHAWLGRAPIDGSKPGDAGDDAAVARWTADFLACHERAIAGQQAEVMASQALAAGDRERLEKRYRAELDQARAFLEAADVAEPAERRRVRRLRAALLFIDSNRSLPLLAWPAEVIDQLIATEQSLLVFRQRHARMIERVIGRRVGTGGSAGVEYIDQTALTYRVFKELWLARTLLLRADATPPVRNADYYGLRSG